MPGSSGSQPLKRVVACRGTVQLASGIAALWATSGRTATTEGLENHLVIHDLSAPAEQTDEFANCIRLLAEQVEIWKSVHIVSREQVITLQSLLRNSPESACSIVQQQFGFSDCDELYVGQSDAFLLNLLRRGMPQAKQICFGDGIALNFSNDYYRPQCFAGTPKTSFWKRLRTRIRTGLKRLTHGSGHAVEVKSPYHHHCLLLKNLFDQHLDQVQLIERSEFRELFDRFGENFAKAAPESHQLLSDLAQTATDKVVLLTSNFAETGRMTLLGEIRGYAELLSSLPQGEGTTLVVKPHPRDSYEKIEELRKYAEKRYRKVIVLNDPWTFYLPFECLYAKYFSQDASNPARTFVATVSSACIALEYLYGQECAVGFGDSLVDELFTPAWSPLRKVHEHDLRKIASNIRKMGYQEVSR